MSSQRNSDNRFANRNVNTAFPRTSSGPGPQNSAPRYGQGLISLGPAPRRSRSGGQPAPKVSVPRPVNLPSLKKENAGNDPATQLVPAGGPGGWQKPSGEEESAQASVNSFETAGSALTAGSNWGSTPAKQGFGGGWQPGGGGDVAAAYAARPPPPSRDQQGRPPPGHPVRDRRLNATEFPSLAAASLPVAPRPPVPIIPATSQRAHAWDEDERQLPTAAALNTGPASWEAGGKAEDDAELFPVGSRADPMDWSSSKQQPEWVGPTAADWQAPVAAADEAPAAPRTPPPDVLPDPPPAAAKPPLPRSIPPRPVQREEPSWRAPRTDHMNGGMGGMRAGPIEAPPPGRARAPSDMDDFPALSDEAVALFPPPPPPPAGHHPPPPPPRKREGLDAGAQVSKLGTADEREAFVSELDRITAELEQEKERTAMEKRRLEAEARQAEMELERQRPPPPPPVEVPQPAPLSVRAALGFPDHQQDPFGSEPDLTQAEPAAHANGPPVDEERPSEARKGRKMNFRPLDVEDVEDKKRKERAAAKLQEIEERIARRQAEEQQLKEEADAARAAADAAAQASQEIAEHEAAEAAAPMATGSLQVVEEDKEIGTAALEADVTAVAAEFAAKVIATCLGDPGSTIASSLAVELGSEHGEGSLDERADQYDGSVEGTASSLKAISVSSNDHTDLVVGVPVAVEQLVPSEPALGVPVDAPSTQAPTLPPQELFFGTASGILRPAAAPPAPSSQAADSKSPAAGDHQPPSATPKPVSATPAEPLPVANAWRKPLQGTPSATKPSPSPDAQAPRAAAGAATLDQASVAAVTGAVPADSGRGGRGRGRGARGRDRDAMPRESRELQGGVGDGSTRGGRGSERGRPRGARRGSRPPGTGPFDPSSAPAPTESPFPEAPLGTDMPNGMRGRRLRGRPQNIPPGSGSGSGSATPSAPSREGSTPRDPMRSPREAPPIHAPVQGQRGRGPRGGRGSGILQRGRGQPQGPMPQPIPGPPLPLPITLPGPPMVAEVPPSAPELQVQAPPGIVTQARSTMGVDQANVRGRASKGSSRVGWSGPAANDPVQLTELQEVAGGSPTSGGGFSPILDPVAPTMPAADGPSASGRGDRVIDRPKSAGLAVSRPKSAPAADQGSSEVLPNGMPPLPADLTFDQPPQPSLHPAAQEQNTSERRTNMEPPAPNPPPHSSAGYGFNVSRPVPQQGFMPAGAFPGMVFPLAPRAHAGMWQMTPGPPGPHPRAPMQPNFEAAVQSFFAAGQGPHPMQMQQEKHGMPQPPPGGPTQPPPFSMSSGPLRDPSQAPPNPLPQFGTFGSFGGNPFPQFGNVGTSFQQSPFVPTGKQPDWSTGPASMVAAGGGRGDPAATRQAPSSFIRRRDAPHEGPLGHHQGGVYPQPPPRSDRPHMDPPGSRMLNGTQMNAPSQGPAMPELDKLVPGMEASGLGMPPGPVQRGPAPGLPGVALPEDLSGSEDLNSQAATRQASRVPNGQVRSRADRGEMHRRPVSGRGAPSRGSSHIAGRMGLRGGARANSRGGPPTPGGPLDSTPPPPGLPGPPRGPNPADVNATSVNGPSGRPETNQEGRVPRQGRVPQDGGSRAPRQQANRGPKAQAPGPGRGRGGHSDSAPRAGPDKLNAVRPTGETVNAA